MIVDFIKLTPQQIQKLKRVTTINTFDYKNDFDVNGLFSLDIFGNLGTKERQEQYGYLKLNTTIISPHLFYDISKLSKFYVKILESKTYATWNDDLKIFEQSTFDEGKTGYGFFVKHLKDIKWERTSSRKRDQRIESIEKHKDKLLLDNILIRPAGLREYVVSKDGVGKEDEVNPLYRKMIGICDVLENLDGSSKAADPLRLRLQHTFQEIYELVYTMSKGKGGLIQNNWTKRSLDGSTRNVITASAITLEDLRDTDISVDMNTTIIGLYQFTKSLSTKAEYKIRTLFIDRILGDGQDLQVSLVDPKSGRFKSVSTPKDVIKYTTQGGLDKYLVEMLKEEEYANMPVKVGKYYLCNIYDDGKEVKVLYDNDLPADRDWKHVRPITLIELITIAILSSDERRYGNVVRFPIVAEGSDYPTKFWVKTTITDRQVKLLDSTWSPFKTLKQFPIRDTQLFKSMAVHPTKLVNLDGDHDGDNMPQSTFWLEDTMDEADRLFNSKRFYIKSTGEWVSSLSTATAAFALKTITSTYEQNKKG